ncbi:hypothetical protein [Pectobacterium punjabense]|uniref:hypothetical protein n=1 Tax=Pectobacterium punjabense TaxID=2108399 RepID=UPI00240556B0|nr:hypothetical protein [Pectobacterium punjabense]MDG0795646.1 hypothetical protein [Pectobacterium punjabense]
MATPDDFIPIVRRYINGPLDLQIWESLIEAAITFCRESLFCRDTQEIDDVKAGEIYTLTGGQAQRAVKLFQILDYSDQQSNASAPARLLRAGKNFTVSSAGTVKFSGDYKKVVAFFASAPMRDATEIQDVLFNDWAEVIAHGALESLYLMHAQEWSEPKRAEYFKQTFTEGYRRAYREALDRPGTTWVPRPVITHEFY